MSNENHFISLADLDAAAFASYLDLAIDLKAKQRAGERDAPLAGRMLGMIFEKASTRT